jgi:hypothetical protein
MWNRACSGLLSPRVLDAMRTADAGFPATHLPAVVEHSCVTTTLLHVVCLQYALDYYPPFASGCGFILSRDLVQALLKQPLPDYRLLVRAQLHPQYSCACSACSWWQ